MSEEGGQSSVAEKVATLKRGCGPLSSRLVSLLMQRGLSHDKMHEVANTDTSFAASSSRQLSNLAHPPLEYPLAVKFYPWGFVLSLCCRC